MSNIQRQVELDVRDFHSRGEEPFPVIMRAVQQLGPGDSLVLLNTFEPRPLYLALKAQGFAHTAEQLGPEHYRITFTRSGESTGSDSTDSRKGGSNSVSDAITCDVRGLPPQERHPLIFRTFTALNAGEKMILVNDHDPKPLYYQMSAEMPGQFEWSYLEEGPRDWRVAITRR